MLNEKIIAKNALIDCLIDNNRFSNRVIKADQIGAEDFRLWKTLVNNVHKPAYDLFEAQENHADTTAAENALFDVVKVLLGAIGDLTLVDKDGNEHKAPIVIDDKFIKGLGDVCSNYAGKIGKDKAPALQLVESKISNTATLLRKYKAINGTNPDAIKAMEEDLEALKAEKAELMDTADMCKDKPAVASENSFRKHFEHHLARVIAGQKAQSWEEYLAAKEAKRLERRQRTADKKKAEKADKKA